MAMIPFQYEQGVVHKKKEKNEVKNELSYAFVDMLLCIVY